jgi:hypothetical protein
LNQLTANLGRQPVVTVSDIKGFVKTGGQIEFVSKGNRLSFTINHTAMKERGLQASASLLNLATEVL